MVPVTSGKVSSLVRRGTLARGSSRTSFSTISLSSSTRAMASRQSSSSTAFPSTRARCRSQYRSGKCVRRGCKPSPVPRASSRARTNTYPRSRSPAPALPSITRTSRTSRPARHLTRPTVTRSRLTPNLTRSRHSHHCGSCLVKTR
ncbi:hypothetical protein FA95DRAFT_1220637 [Auriscalpium vulgare]|uniref:Uncharacterized protein n=1 Tax=Auriscalpium vulgare TaxID=40419 RepID=A0ACB8R2V9_9AGAM|nr:hypothetical protein FA95DRAFT_1220637 [Auriscalpium vulgare]